jgi:hypothetical protein
MKKIAVMMALLAGSLYTFGQTLDEINDMMGKLQYRKAKEGVDKFLADPKNAGKADGWYFKGRIYNSLSKDSSIATAEALQLKLDAYDAFVKYQQMDAKDVRFILENHASYVDLYNGFFDIGSNSFDAKNYSAAADAFRGGLKVEDYVRSKGYDYNGFKFPVLDTSLVLNAAISLKLANKYDEAVVYYRKLVDAGVNKEQYLDVYLFLIEYYSKKNDNSNLQAVMDKAKQIYPATDWTQMAIEIELEKLGKDENKDVVFAKYQELIKQYPGNYFLLYNYSVEMFNMLYFPSDKKIPNPDALKAEIETNLKNAIAVASKEKINDANTLMANFMYNSAIDYNDSSLKYKGMKPDDVKKRNEFKALYQKKIDECIPYADAVVKYFAEVPKLRPTQKANYKLMLDKLSQLYTAKGNAAKAAEYDKKKDDVDKL